MVNFTHMQIHCPSPNECPDSLHQFKKYFDSLNNNYAVDYYCSNCMTNLCDGKQCENNACIKQKAKVCELAVFFT